MKRGPTVTVWDAIGATGRARLATSRESVSSEILDGRYYVSDNKLLALSKESDGWTRPAVEVDHGVPLSAGRLDEINGFFPDGTSFRTLNLATLPGFAFPRYRHTRSSTPS